MRKVLRALSWEIAVILSLGAPGLLFAQTTSEPTPSAQNQEERDQKKKPTASQIWTDDNITSLRTAADIHMARKNSPVEKTSPDSTSGIKEMLPGSGADPGQQTANTRALSPGDNPEALERLIVIDEQDVRRKQEVFDAASNDAARAGSDLERSGLESNVQIAKADLDASKDDLKNLRARLAQLRSGGGSVSSPARAPTTKAP